MDKFNQIRENTIGIEQPFETPYGTQKTLYADWTASGRLYRPIENKIANEFGAYIGNTHSESNMTGSSMTYAYQKAQNIIKQHVNADLNDVLISEGNGMTGCIVRFQRILGMKLNEKWKNKISVSDENKPIVFITHMEHHSNHTSWLETIADVVVIPPGKDGLVDLNKAKITIEGYKDRKIKIGAFTACSNVTGIRTPYHQLAKLIHQNNGLCFVDFAANAPYDEINMHPEDPLEKLDAIFFSPHKFLGGPGSCGVMIFDSRLYKNTIPDRPGGGTVNWTNPWGEYSYVDNIEAREDGGTPGFLQTIRVALSIKLKEEMGVDNIHQRERSQTKRIFESLEKIPKLHILAGEHKDRLGIISFFIEGLHYNLIVKLLNDKFGIQVRGGCSCAGTYGHLRLDVDQSHSRDITTKIDNKDLSEKPGWVRLSVHPVMTDSEIEYLIKGITDVAKNASEWAGQYKYSTLKNEFTHNNVKDITEKFISDMFN